MDEGRRSLGLVSAAALVVASMIGAGVFTTSGFLLSDLRSGWSVLLAWLLGGTLAMLGTLCYGALARRLPESGGEYLFLSRTVHPALGFMAGWTSFLVGFSAPMAAAAYAFGQYLSPWFGHSQVTAKTLGTVLMVAFGILHGLHTVRGASVQNLTVVVKLVLISGFIGFGWFHGGSVAEMEGQTATVSTMAVSLVWISFSYSGWNAAVYMGGEIRDPERNLPRAMLLGTGVVTILYVALNYAFLTAAPAAVLSGQLEVGRIAAEAMGGPTWGGLVAITIALAMVTSVSSITMAGPRVYAQMAKDGCLPGWFQGGEGPPRMSILIQCAAGLILLWTATYQDLLTFIGFTLSLCTAATVFGLIRLRLKEGNSVRIAGWPVVPFLFMAGVLFIAGHAIVREPMVCLTGGGALAAGWLAWVALGRRN